jgi:uncharacterized protein DUF4349
MRRSRLLVLLVLGLVLGIACSQSATSPTALEGRGGSAGVASDTAIAKSAPAAVPAPNGVTTPAEGIPSLANLSRDLILTANVSMRSADPWATADQARGIAAGLGGDLLALSQTGSGDTRNAMLTMRVPSSRFDEAIAQLKKLDGEVVSSSVGAKDATDQLVDLDARITAAQALEQRYLQLSASAKTVDEMLRVEGALQNVRTQIEQLKAQQKTIKDQVTFSTITLAVASIPTIPPVGNGPTWDPSQTFARAVAALTTLLRAGGDLAIWILVIGWIPLVILGFTFVAARLVVRRVPAA